MASVKSVERSVLKLLQRAVKSDPITIDEVMSLTCFNMSPAAYSAWLVLCQWLSDADLRDCDHAYAGWQMEILKGEIEALDGTSLGPRRVLAPARRLRRAVGTGLLRVRHGLAEAGRGAVMAPVRLARVPRNLLAP